MSTIMRLLVRGFRDMALHPWAHSLTLASLCLVAFLAGLLLLAVDNLDREIMRSRAQAEFQLYWEREVGPEILARAWDSLGRLPGAVSVHAYTPDQALEALAQAMGERVSIGPFKGRSPLPPTALAVFAVPREDDGSWAPALLRALKELPGVETVHYNPLQVDAVRAWTATSRRVVWPLVGFLGLLAAMIVGNTIKLSQISRRQEIEILHLVGAADWYIRLPLLTVGAVLGLAGSVMALGLLKFVQHSFRDVLDFAPLFVRIEFLPPLQTTLIIAGLTVVSTLSSWAAIRE